MINDKIIKKAKQYIKELINLKLPQGIVFHSLDHTTEVFNTAREIGKSLGIQNDELSKLLIAALFHDSGMTQKYTGHEEISEKICRDFLKQNNLPFNEINEIGKIILSTNRIRKPDSVLEEIIRDADLSHIGSPKYLQKLNLLRKEWEIVLKKKFTDSEWYHLNIEFLDKNEFYTTYAKKKYKNGKEKNLIKLQKLLARQKAKI